MLPALLTAILATLAPSPNMPATAAGSDLDLCIKGDADVRIAACTRVLGGEYGTGSTCLAHNNRALGYVLIGEYDKALPDLNKVVVECHDSDASYFNRGVVYVKTGNFDHAISDFNATLETMPNLYWAMIDRAEARLYKHDYPHAMADLARAFRLTKTDWSAYAVRCEARAFMGVELDAALQDCQGLIESDQPPQVRGTALGFRALIEYRRGEGRKALDDLDEANTSNPGESVFLYARGLVKRSLGDGAGADSDVRAAAAINPHMGEVFAAYGLN